MLLKKLLENVHELGFPAIQFCRIIESNCFRTTRTPAERIRLPLGFSQIFELPKKRFPRSGSPRPGRIFETAVTPLQHLMYGALRVVSSPQKDNIEPAPKTK